MVAAGARVVLRHDLQTKGMRWAFKGSSADHLGSPFNAQAPDLLRCNKIRQPRSARATAAPPLRMNGFTAAYWKAQAAAASRLQTNTPAHPAVSAAPATSTQMMTLDKAASQVSRKAGLRRFGCSATE